MGAKLPKIPSQESIENRFAGLEGLEAREPGDLEAGKPGGWPKVPSREPIENRFAGLEGLEAREPRGLEARRPGG